MGKRIKNGFPYLEENYWWYVGRRDAILGLVKEEKKTSKILEIGCGDGNLIKCLENIGFKQVWGIDNDEEAVRRCKKRGIKNVFVMDGAKTGFMEGEFDILIASDILEHIKDDNKALKEWNRILKDSGKLIIFVPAFNFLFSGHDKISRHYRRYSKFELVRKLKSLGFNVEKSSYWNFLLFFPAFLVRTTQRKKHQFYRLNSTLNRLLTLLLKIENNLLKILDFPIGVSVFAVARKR